MSTHAPRNLVLDAMLAQASVAVSAAVSLPLTVPRLLRLPNQPDAYRLRASLLAFFSARAQPGLLLLWAGKPLRLQRRKGYSFSVEVEKRCLALGSCVVARGLGAAREP
jgi:hypothetical protein